MLALLSLSILPACQGGAWQELRQHPGPIASRLYGWTCAGVGDVNGDGVPDYAIGDPDGGPLGSGQVFVFDGASGNLHLQSAPAALDGSDNYGASIAGGKDLDGDGLADLIVGSPDYGLPGQDWLGRVFAISGLSGAVIHEFRGATPREFLGTAVALLTDFTGDARAEMAYTSPFTLGGGVESVTIRRSTTGGLWKTEVSPAPGNGFGASLASTSNYVGYGELDLLIGAPMHGSQQGALYRVGYSIGSSPYVVHLGAAGDEMGWAVANAGDVSGDTVNDQLVGGFGAAAPSGTRGLARVVDGLTHATLFEYVGRHPSANLGNSVASLGDVNRDGKPDFVIGAPGLPGLAAGVVYVGSGHQGRELAHLREASTFGWSVAGVGDLTGDGRPEFLACETFAFGGVARLYSFDPFLTVTPRQISAAAGGGATLALDFPAFFAGHSYRVLLSRRAPGWLEYGVTIPMHVDALLLETAAGITPPRLNAAGFSGTLDALGDATATITVAPGALTGSVGLTLTVCAVAMPSPGALPIVSSGAERVQVVL